MRHHNSVFHQLLKQVPGTKFDRLVEEHGADWRVRRLSTKSQFVALLYGQLSQAASLREIEAGLSSHRSRLYHLGAGPVCRSTLADAKAQRPAEVFCELLAALSPLAFARLVRANLMHRRRIDRLLTGPRPTHQSRTAGPAMDLNLNKTAVGSSPAMTE